MTDNQTEQMQSTILTHNFEDLPLQLTETEYKKEGWRRDIKRTSSILEILDLWNIEDENNPDCMTQVLRYLKCTISMLKAKYNDWRPIETAPKDTSILVYALGVDGRPMRVIVRWGCPEHAFDSSIHKCDCENQTWLGVLGAQYGIEFTHWIPLPVPPTYTENSNDRKV